MIGLAISVVASNLLLTQEGDCAPAAEPVGNEPTSSIIPAATEAEGESTKSVEPEAVLVAMVPPTPRVQLIAAVSTQVLPVVERTVQKGQTLRQLSQKYQVGVATTYRIKPSQISAAATAAPYRLLVEKSRRVGEVNAPLKAKQRVVSNRLKQKSNRFKEILAPLQSKESNNSLAATEQQAAWRSLQVAMRNDTVQATVIVPALQLSAVNKPTVLLPSARLDYRVKAGDTLSAIARQHDISLKEIVTANKLTDPDRLQINQRLTIPRRHSSTVGIGATYGQLTASLSPKVATIDNSAVLNAQKSKDTPSLAIIVPTLRLSAVNKPTVLLASARLDYRVKAGDTLSAIARQHNISLKEIVTANKLTDPDRLQINQRLTIAAFQYSSAFGQTIAANNSSVSVPTLSTRSESIRSNRADALQLESAAVPQPLAKTASLGVNFSGIGGSISDETDSRFELAHSTAASGIGGSISDLRDESPSAFNKSQLESTTAKPEKLQLNPYVQNLQTDIQRLQQKYYAQQTVSQVVPRVSQTVTVAAPAQTLKPTQVKSPVLPKARVATAPSSVDASESLQSPKVKQVSPDLPPLATVDTYLPKPFETATGFKGYIWPTKVGALTSGYGRRWGRMHKGIDIAAPIGTPIVAAASGVVIKAGWNSGGYGKLVDIQHADGTFTRYAHNNRILVQAGQQVEQGQQISEMGNTGRSTGPHLHFEVHPAGKGAVNPIAFLRRP